jgi:hypothetical protein
MLRRAFLTICGCLPFASVNAKAEPGNQLSDFATARRRVCDELGSDEGLLIGYRANIACMIHDRDGIAWEHANQTADAICNLLFETNLPIVRRETN